LRVSGERYFSMGSVFKFEFWVGLTRAFMN
jgi:hypothetical protein